MKNKPQNYYSWIAYNYCKENDIDMITYGDLDLMHNLFDLFGGNRDELHKKGYSGGQRCHKEFQSVMNKLDREYKKQGTILEKYYITYNGIINHPTRAYRFIESRVKKFKGENK